MSRPEHDGALPSLAGAEWLTRPETLAVFEAVGAEGAEVRAVGGAVRNALLGVPVKDVDLATTALPGDVMRLAKRAGLHAVPTGFEHGTVTVVSGKVPFEVTTLRRDIETYGRHAKVTFTEDWREDAMRRDFTMNALYSDANGIIYDPLGGYQDLKAKRVRFIGDARARIREDYLRILRFFRFGAVYTPGGDFDAEGLAACIAEKAGVEHLSGERVRAELMLLLAAPGAVPALAVMHEGGLLEPMLGVPRNIALVEKIAEIEQALGRAPNALLRLAALVDGVTREAVQEKLRLSRAETLKLEDAARIDPAFAPHAGEEAAKAFIYRHGARAFEAGALMDWARSADAPQNVTRVRHVKLPERWTAPVLPVRGADVVALGITAGPAVGRIVAKFEEWWVSAGFPAEEALIRAKVEELARGESKSRRNA
jgi:poly(A) polymerase